MSRPTPETDALRKSIDSGANTEAEMTLFALKLERERDEARESLKHITEYGTEEINAAVELRQKLASALVERDEAREELKKLEGAYEDATNYYARMIELREERDEWRQCAEKLYNSSGWHDEWPIAVQNYKKIKNEK